MNWKRKIGCLLVAILAIAWGGLAVYGAYHLGRDITISAVRMWK